VYRPIESLLYTAGTCESAVCVRIEYGIESGVQ